MIHIKKATIIFFLLITSVITEVETEPEKRLLVSNRKTFLYYSGLSVSEGLDRETNELQMNLDSFNKDIFKKCRYCHHVFAIKNKFEKDEETCNACIKLLEK